MRKIKLTLLLIALAILFTACTNANNVKPSTETAETSETKEADKIEEMPVLLIIENTWSVCINNEGEEVAVNNKQDHVFRYPAKGNQLVSQMNAVIEVDEVTDEKIKLKLTGLVEENEDGSANLNKKQLDHIYVKMGEEVKLVTQTMDAGAEFIVVYKQQKVGAKID